MASEIAPQNPTDTPISVVMLAHNEAQVIEKTVRDFYGEVVHKHPNSELIVAEDGSTDGTKEILLKLTQELSQLRWVEGKERRGYVRAFKEAMKLPKNEIVLFCDCSGKHDPKDAWKMLPLMSQADLVVGFKESRADPIYRVALSRVFNSLVNAYFGTHYKDINCPLRVFKRSAFLEVAKDPWLEKALVNFEMTLRFVGKGYVVRQVPIQHFRRAHGPSRGLPLSKIPKVIRNVLTNFPKLKTELFANQSKRSVLSIQANDSKESTSL